MIVDVDLRLYSKEALIAVLYEYSGQYNIKQTVSDDGGKIKVTLTPKTSDSFNMEEAILSYEFEKKLIDQQLRIQINEKFGHIRDLIVEEAFRPVSK